jgi:hypothetical protein
MTSNMAARRPLAGAICRNNDFPTNPLIAASAARADMPGKTEAIARPLSAIGCASRRPVFVAIARQHQAHQHTRFAVGHHCGQDPQVVATDPERPLVPAIARLKHPVRRTRQAAGHIIDGGRSTTGRAYAAWSNRRAAKRKQIRKQAPNCRRCVQL